MASQQREELPPPECLYCGGSELRLDVATGAVDCVDCGADVDPAEGAREADNADNG